MTNEIICFTIVSEDIYIFSEMGDFLQSIALLSALVVSSLWTILLLRSAISSMHASKKTREEKRNIKKGYSWIQRLFLLHVKDSTAGDPRYNKYRRFLEKFLTGYAIASLVLWALVIVGIFVPRFNVVLIVLMSVKVILIDGIGAGFYIHFNTKKDKKRSTLHWKWTQV